MLKTLHPPVMIPMPGGAVRSLNLATAVGIALYEALRQIRQW
jgi:tRNA (cytidine/uridine-2'-O-)-methyltransferase